METTVPSKRKNPSTQTTKKRRIDRISNLPEPILCHILSFLPTKTTVATSALSKRWEILWTLLPNLDFDDLHDQLPERYDDPEPEVTFTHFVCRVLLLRKEWGIKKFRLRCASDFDEHHVESWVSAAVARGVEELDVNFPGFVFPRSLLYSCNTLVVLKLTVDYISIQSCHFPSLKVLHLLWVEFCNENEDGEEEDYDERVQKFFSGCPVLEDLVLKRSRGDDDLRICVPTLRSLLVEFRIDPPREVSRRPLMGFRQNDDGYNLELETPALEYFSFKHHATKNSLVANLCNLAEADVDAYVHEQEKLDKSYGSCVVKLLGTLSNVKCLKLSSATMKGLGYASFNELPVFPNLVRLELNVKSCDWVVLPHLLEKFHNLEYLSLDKKVGNAAAQACWREPSGVPKCLSLHLMTFCFRGFEGLEAEMEFTRYVLKNSMVLKNVKITTSSSLKAKADVLQALSKVMWGSKTCQLQFN